MMKKLFIAIFLSLGISQATFTMLRNKLSEYELGEAYEKATKLKNKFEQELKNKLSHVSTYNVATLKEISGLVWSLYLYEQDCIILGSREGLLHMSTSRCDQVNDLKDYYLRMINIIDVHERNLPTSRYDLFDEKRIKSLIDQIKTVMRFFTFDSDYSK